MPFDYRARGDFVGMDMARKFLQMGYTRSRRYANHRSGRKYAKDGGQILPREEDAEKGRISPDIQRRMGVGSRRPGLPAHETGA